LGTPRLVHRVTGSDVIGLLVAAAFFVAMFLVAFWIAESLIVSVAKKAARAIDEDRERRRDEYEAWITEQEDRIAEQERMR
jgi:hypothetical protein